MIQSKFFVSRDYVGEEQWIARLQRTTEGKFSVLQENFMYDVRIKFAFEVNWNNERRMIEKN